MNFLQEDGLTHARQTRVPERVLTQLGMPKSIYSEKELGVLTDVAESLATQKALGVNSSEDALGVLLSASSLHRLAEGRRAIITPLAKQSFDKLRNASATHNAESRADHHYICTDDSVSIVVLSQSSRLGMNLYFNEEYLISGVEINEVEKCAANIGASQKLVNEYLAEVTKVLANLVEIDPKNDLAIRIKEHGSSLQEELLCVFLSSQTIVDFHSKLGELGVEKKDLPYVPDKYFKEERLKTAKKFAPFLDTVSPESISALSAGRDLRDLSETERIDLMLKIIEHPWVTISTPGSVMIVRPEEMKNDLIDVHTHPFNSGSLPFQFFGSSGVELKKGVNAYWTAEQVKAGFDSGEMYRVKELQIAGMTNLEQCTSIELQFLKLFRDDPNGKEKLALTLDTPAGEQLRGFCESLMQLSSREIDQKIATIEHHLELLGGLVSKDREQLLKLQGHLEFGDQLRVIDPENFTNTPSVRDRDTYSIKRQINLPDGTQIPFALIVTPLGISSVSYDKNLAVWSVNMQTEIDSTIKLVKDYRVWHHFDQDHHVAINLNDYPKSNYNISVGQFVSEGGENVSPMIIRNKLDDSLKVALPVNNPKSPSAILVSWLQDKYGEELQFYTPAKSNDRFLILDPNKFKDFDLSAFKEIAALSSNPEIASQLQAMWERVSLLRLYPTGVSERYDLAQNIFRRYPENPDLYFSIVDSVEEKHSNASSELSMEDSYRRINELINSKSDMPVEELSKIFILSL